MEFRLHFQQKIFKLKYILQGIKGKLPRFKKVQLLLDQAIFLKVANLVANREFNVELKNQSDLDFALNQFEELWSQSVDVSQDTIDNFLRRKLG